MMPLRLVSLTIIIQHKQLFHFANELQEGIKTGIKVSDIDSTLTQATHYSTRYFTIDERYMAEINHQKTIGHLMAHQSFTLNLNEIQAEFENPIKNSYHNRLNLLQLLLY